MQRRDPASVLYALVFLLLTFGFVSSGAIELVRERATMPKLAPLSIALALSGLTAFGQVISTMIVASAVLRDRAVRTHELLWTSPVMHSAWVTGRWCAALLVMGGVHSALIAGVWLGAMAPWVYRDVSIAELAARTLWPWFTVTVPTTVAVATVLTAVAVRTQRLIMVLAAAVALLFVWQGCESVVRPWVQQVSVLASAGRTNGDAAVAGRANGDAAVTVAARGAAVPVRVQAAAMIDPFGTTALQVVTAPWSESERLARLVPVGGLVGASRALWVCLAAVAALIALRSPPHRLTPVHSARQPARAATATATATAAERTPMLASIAWPRWIGIAAFTARWTWNDRGWMLVGALGALNVLSHVAFAAATELRDAVQLLALIQEHTRLFLIVLATIYAGELLWRDQDERVAALVQSAPVSSFELVGGRVVGLFVAQAMLVLALLLTSWTGALVRHEPPSLFILLVLGALWLWLPFAQWLVLSLTVHVLVRHKIIAHLLLIAGWVAAVALDANGAVSPWIRFADPPSLRPDMPVPLGDAMWRAAWWSTVSAALLAITVRAWRRATSPR